MLKNIRTYRNSTLLILLLLFVNACQDKEQPPIAVDKMKTILLDIHFAEAYSSLIETDSIQKSKFNKNTDSLAVFYKQILKQHQTSVAEFETALKWYALHPQLLDTVYTRIMPVMDSLKTIPADTTRK